MRTRRLLSSLTAATALVALPLLTGASAGSTALAAAACPDGYVHEADTDLASFAAGADGTCVPAVHPEPFSEWSQAQGLLASRASAPFSTVASGAYASAVSQAQAISRASTPSATWKPLGVGPLRSDVADYKSVSGLGLVKLSGRVEDLAADPRSASHLFAAVVNGGVWETTNAGKSWHSVGDALPTQVTGALAYTKSGTLVVGTGDPAYGGSSISGLGAYWSSDRGKHWHHAKGIPNGTITFSVAVDPRNPKTIYMATGKGLWRSTDTGRSYSNVKLPTTCTDVRKPTCFFANMVTDVVVHAGTGKVLAAVGWRAGTKPNAQGKPQSPRNGLYTSATGKPGSFTYLGSPLGFTAQRSIGRTSLGIANGKDQDHDFVFAVVQDADRFNKATTFGGIIEPDGLPTKAPDNTVLNGIYGSDDFGASWTKLADSLQLATPATGTALVGANSASYAPGVQAWYNSWVSVDPTQQLLGRPTRIALGLEEVWENDGPIVIAPGAVTGAAPNPLGPVQQVSPVTPVHGTTTFKVIGRYFAGTSCLGLNTGALIPGGLPACPTNRGLVATKTTHPDQHAGLFVPSGENGVTLFAGNDGGVYKQSVASGGDFANDGWGDGANDGLHTLLPYDVAMSKDGTAYIGLQDNGTAKITPAGKQIGIYGGDGFYVATDPDSSNIAWEEYTGGDIRVSRDGGKTWTGAKPAGITAALFATPFVMDRTDASHLATGGRQVFETTRGAATGTSWTKVFDLGTRTKPGKADATAAAGDPDNSLSAVDTRGKATYVGFCGYCDVVTGGVPFSRGLATNVGDKGADKASSTGWHIAKAAGLPQRYITGVTVDPRDKKTVYVTLGGYGRRWIPPGALGDSTSKVGKGHVFVSHDAGAHFKDISGNLPDAPANDTVLHGKDLVVATDVGVYVSKGSNGGRYTRLGKGLPNVPTFQVNASPRSKDELVAATYGRGAYVIRLGSAGSSRSGSAVEAAGGTQTGASAAAPAAGDSATTAAGGSTTSSKGMSSTAAATSVGLTALGAALVVVLALRRRRAHSPDAGQTP